MKWTLLAAIALSVAVVAAGGCSREDSERTGAAYCQDLAALGNDEGGPTDHIFEQYGDDPSLAEWAAGLPEAIRAARDSRAEFAEVEPSADLGGERRALLAALDAVIDSFEGSLEAARAGDQQAFDRHEAENQDELVPTMNLAMQDVMQACAEATE